LSGSGLEPVLAIFAFAIGAVLGSFANVCIHRLPRGESVVSPPSRCPACGRRIAARDNVPVLGWLLLGGRCRACGARISPRYPLVELLVGLIFLGAFWRWGMTTTAAGAALLVSACVILVATDLEARVLPDEITIGGAVLGIALAAVCDFVSRSPLRWGESSFLESVAGAAAGAGLLLAIRGAYQALRGVEGMGLGDVKMIAMIGAFLGPAGVLLSLFFGSLSGALLGISLVAVRTLRWARARTRARDGDIAGAARAGGGLALDAGGILAATGRGWDDLPGSARTGQPPELDRPLGRPVLAFLRLARRRAAKGLVTVTGRLIVEDDDFFRVLAARYETVRGHGLLFLSRADIPFGVFLAAGAVAALVLGRAALARVFGELPVPASHLLP
jgi:leader peptidase (prepilin peptidase)/N-methyltransferase